MEGFYNLPEGLSEAHASGLCMNGYEISVVKERIAPPLCAQVIGSREHLFFLVMGWNFAFPSIMGRHYFENTIFKGKDLTLFMSLVP